MAGLADIMDLDERIRANMGQAQSDAFTGFAPFFAQSVAAQGAQAAPAPPSPPQPKPPRERLTKEERQRAATWQALADALTWEKPVLPLPMYPNVPLDKAGPDFVPMQPRVGNLPRGYGDLLREMYPEKIKQGYDVGTSGWPNWRQLPRDQQELLLQIMLMQAREAARRRAKEKAATGT